jgi:2-iminobutanoate/2-iminopropanoate deaminase
MRKAAQMASRQIFTTQGQRHTSPIPQGVIGGGFAFLSAIRGVDIETQKVPEDAEQQVRNAFAVLTETLKSFNASLSDVVRIGVYMKDLQGDRPVFNKVWKETFQDDPPARFAVQVLDMGGPGDHSKFLLDVIAKVPE